MTASLEERLSATVVRYDVQKLRLGQALVPFAFVATTLARHMPGAITGSAAVALLLAVLGAFLLGRKSCGHRTLGIVGGKIDFGEPTRQIVPANVSRWTLNGSTARLYRTQWSWKLKAGRGNGDKLRGQLVRVLGKPLPMNRRGSLRARRIALGVALAGLSLSAVAIGFDLVALVFVGVPALTMGLATFGALSQKVIAGGSRD